MQHRIFIQMKFFFATVISSVVELSLVISVFPPAEADFDETLHHSFSRSLRAVHANGMVRTNLSIKKNPNQKDALLLSHSTTTVNFKKELKKSLKKNLAQGLMGFEAQIISVRIGRCLHSTVDNSIQHTVTISIAV